jgi:FG-GAP-like repeat
LIGADYGNNTANVMLGVGDGTFEAEQAYNMGNGPYIVAVGDVNGNGKSDMVASDSGANTASVLLGNGTFRARQIFATGSGVGSLALFDLNGDGVKDLVTSPTRMSPTTPPPSSGIKSSSKPLPQCLHRRTNNPRWLLLCSTSRRPSTFRFGVLSITPRKNIFGSQAIEDIICRSVIGGRERPRPGGQALNFGSLTVDDKTRYLPSSGRPKREGEYP